jgi:alpha-tubulin suppressor-like RCC1 family protein
MLGYPDIEEHIGDDESPASAGDVVIGGEVVAIQAYYHANCALLANGEVTCWGDGSQILGYGDSTSYGDVDNPSAAPSVSLGGVATTLGGGPRCVIMSNGDVRCWGPNDYGQLGLGHTDALGDDELPHKAPSVDLGGKVVRLASGGVTGLGHTHQCALLENRDVRCWGNNESGQLGLAHQENAGDNELPRDEPTVRVLE